MRPLKILSVAILMAGLAFHGGGCASQKKIPPAYEEVLVYPLPFDLVYLRTLEALENVQGWELQETEKEKGIIRVRNISYSRLDDSDKRTATILIKRMSRRETAVSLAPYSNQVLGGASLMKSISQYVSREL